MNSIKKLVIPAAGLGTRMLPVTKTVPKEMLPVLNKPVIQWIVENAVAAGIKDIILVTSSGKKSLEDYFEAEENLEKTLLASGKDDVAQKLKNISNLANFIYVRQKGPYGTGTPVLNVKEIIGNEPFALVWGDDICQCPGKPHLRQLIEVYEKYGHPVVSLVPTDDEGTKRYGMIEGRAVAEDVYLVKAFKEKPGPENTASRLAAVSGYILTPDIFAAIENLPRRAGREVYLVDAIANLIKERPVLGKLIEGEFFDTGSPLSWLKTNIALGLRDEGMGEELEGWLKNKMIG